MVSLCDKGKDPSLNNTIFNETRGVEYISTHRASQFVLICVGLTLLEQYVMFHKIKMNAV